MKNNGRWTFTAFTLLYFLLCISGCERRSENVATSKVENTPVAAPTEATPLPKETPTPTPVPIERKDVRITGLMIGTGVGAKNEIKNPTSTYHVSDSIFALVRTSGSGPEATIKLSCKDSAGNVVFEESKKIIPKGEASMVFTLTSQKKFSVGAYRLVGLLDEFPTMAVSIEVLP